MGEPRWLTRLIVDTIHSELLLEHGGAAGIAAGGDDLLESALARAAATFLLLNGLRLTASESDAYDAVIGIVEGTHTELDLAGWFRGNTEPVR